MQEILLEESVDTHTHPRDTLEDGDGRMETIVPLLAEEHGTIVAIGNTKPAILDGISAHGWRAKILARVPQGRNLEVLVAPLMTDKTTAEMVREGRHKHGIRIWKIFLSGVSNDGGNSVSDIRLIDDAIRATYTDLPPGTPTTHIMIHAERKHTPAGVRIEMRDREWQAIQNDAEPLVRRHPKCEYTIAHVSDGRTVDWIFKMRAQGFKVWGEIAAHYLFRCHEDLYEQRGVNGTAFQGNDLCWPLYKSEWSMEKLRAAALSGSKWFHYGSDCACWTNDVMQTSGVKINCEGEVCGGVTILPSLGKSLIINFFLQNKAEAWKIDAFFSRNARDKLGLSPSPRKVRYVREDWTVPLRLTGIGPRGETTFFPFMRGEIAHYKRAE